MDAPTFIDLFSGCGGLACGLEQAGLKSVWAVEIDPDAAGTYGANFHHGVYCGPIEKIRTLAQIPKSARRADVVVGGPPCQGFSPLGRFSPREAHAQMNELWQHFLRIVELVDPQVFLVENVPEFLRSAEGEEALRVARLMGYWAEPYVLKAVDYGVPQRRVRGFILATKCGAPSPPPTNGPTRTVRDAIGDLPEVPTGEDWHLARNPRPKSIERYRVVPEGGNRFDLMRERPDITPRCWLEKPSGSTDVFGRLSWAQPALTIRTEFYKPEKGRYLHPQAHRPITHREAMRLQTFPDDFTWVGSRISVARQVGNAVPPELARHWGLRIQELLVCREPAIR